MRAHLSAFTAFGLVLVAGTASAEGADSGDNNAQPKPLTAEECALIENGVRRLACYDRVLDPGKARQDAEPEKVKQVEQEADKT
ncbi:MAG: hypothetical protein ABJF99_08440, partial [Marinobacter alexandrii]